MLDLPTIRAARARVAAHVHVTPVLSATMLGDRRGVRLVLKCESFQKTGSFKPRGALNRLLQLGDEERRRGVVTFSAGNHAQALAWASRVAGVRATVVMPAAASPAKAEASRGYGAEVVLHGANGMEALARMKEIQAERGLTFVHPFDDEEIQAGTGTVALELLEQVDDVDVIVVAIGGGGLIAGIATAAKAIRPTVRVYGVEPEGAAAMRRSLDEGHAVTLPSVKTIADGLAAPMAGDRAFEVVKRYVDDVVVIPDDAIAAAVRDLVIYAKLVTEPAGAASVAGVLSGAVPVKAAERVACIVSGGNVDAAKLAALLG
jgi:threonine dehydratase